MKTAFGLKCGTHICASGFFCDAVFKSAALKTARSTEGVVCHWCGDSRVCRHYLAKKVPQPSQKVTFSISP